MFCSRCGNELNDGAKFCDNCGKGTGAEKTKTQAAGALTESITEIPANERSAKLRAIIAFFIENALIIGLIISLISSKFTAAASFIDCSYSSFEKIRELLEVFYEKTLEPWSWVIILLLIGNFIFVLTKFYITPFVKRNFRISMSNLHKCAHFGSLIFAVYIVLAGALFVQDSDFEINWGIYILGAVIIALRFTTVLLYRSAAYSEPDFERIKFDEALKTEGKWQCGKCGSYNPLTVQSCRDCGSYK